MSWRVRALVREGLLNVGSTGWRTAGLTVAVALVLGALAAFELRDADELRTFQSSYAASGGYVAIGVPAPGVANASAARCESLNSASGVVAAGAQGPGQVVSLASAPGVLFQRTSITPGVINVWRREARVPLADGGYLVVGLALAEELGLRERSTAVFASGEAVPVALILDTSDRNPQVNRWAFDVGPPDGPVDSCWVEFEPGAYEAGLGALPSLMTSGDEEATARPYFRRDEFTRDPAADFGSRPQRNGWPLASGLLAGLIALATWFRRAELGLYLAVGTGRPALLFMLAIETLLVLVVGLLLALIYAFAIDEALHHSPGSSELVIMFRTTASAALLAMVVAPLAAVAVVRGNIADLLKER